MMINILVTATGAGIAQSIIKGIKLVQQPNYRLIGIDANPWAAGIYRCHKGYIVPRADETEYIPKIIEIIKKEDIDIIFPGCDPELPILAKNRIKIEKETGALVVVGSIEAVEIGRDKYKTYQFLKENRLPYPKTALLEDAEQLLEEVGFPLVVKPRRGSGTRGVSIIFNKKELRQIPTTTDILQEYLIPVEWELDEIGRADVWSEGLLRQVDEYSTETLVSKQGNILGSITNWRTMKKGDPVRAIVNQYDKINIAAEKVVQALIKEGLVGPCNLQCRCTERGPVFFEVNPRFSGSTAVRCVAGFNGPDAMIKSFVLNKDYDAIRAELKYEKLIEIRYWNELYLSLEDFAKIKETRVIKHTGKLYNYF